MQNCNVKPLHFIVDTAGAQSCFLKVAMRTMSPCHCQVPAIPRHHSQSLNLMVLWSTVQWSIWSYEQQFSIARERWVAACLHRVLKLMFYHGQVMSSLTGPCCPYDAWVASPADFHTFFWAAEPMQWAKASFWPLWVCGLAKEFCRHVTVIHGLRYA